MSLTSLSSLHSVFGVWVLPEVFASLLGLQLIHEAFGRNSHIFAVMMARAALGIWTLSCEPLKMFSSLFGVFVLPWIVSGYTPPESVYGVFGT